LPGVFEALEILKNKEVLTIVVTNQSCVAKGIISEKQLQGIHDKMQKEIQAHKGYIDAVYFCPHDVFEGCDCRKPKPGLIINALGEFRKNNVKINIKESYLIGDSESDIKAGQAVGLMTIKLGTVKEFSDSPIKNLLEAVKSI
jgi:histidinol-phosphate phosphatase family protein